MVLNPFKKEQTQVEKTLNLIKQEEAKGRKRDRKKVLKWYKMRVAVLFLAIIGGISIIALASDYYYNESFSKSGGIILIMVSTWLIIFVGKFIYDLIYPENFTE